MKSSVVTAALSVLGVARALPASSGNTQYSKVNDGFILNYALTLEHLEDTFYREGLKKFNEQDFLNAGFSSAFYKNIVEVSFDEKTHVGFLTGALNALHIKPVEECTYNFAYPDVKTFIATASVLEGVGVSAYLGAAASIAEKAYLTAAGSILTVESRHSSYIRSGLGSSPFPQPFDDPLDFKEVYTLAAPFFVSCPKGSPSLGLKPFPSLTLKSATPKTGDQITLVAGSKLKQDKQLYACFITVTGPVCSPVKPGSDGKTIKTKVPVGPHGQTYVVISNCKDNVNDNTVVAGPAIVEVSGSAGSP